jgi:hypothetical protein
MKAQHALADTISLWSAFWSKLTRAWARTPDFHRYRRIQAPSLCRPSGFVVFADVIVGPTEHVRVYSDERFNPGQMLELDVEIDGMSLTCIARVKWTETLSGRDVARFDVALDVLPMSPETHARLTLVLV